MKNKKIVIIATIIVIIFGGLALLHLTHNSHLESQTSNITHYTCGMHPDIRVSPKEYDNGNTKCPICHMDLVPVYQEEELEYYGCGMSGKEHVFLLADAQGMTCPMCGMELVKLTGKKADELRGIAGQVKIGHDQVERSGIKTEEIQLLSLYKEIRTVGKVAYDPALVIAQEEFLSSLKALDKINQGGLSEIKERTSSLVASARRKLQLLGLSMEQINELEKNRDISTNLLLPEAKMWVYGDVYEYELGWIKVGGKVMVIANSLPGEEFIGVISSINPVIDPKKRSMTFRAEVDNPNLALKPEMYVDVVIMSQYAGAGKDDAVLALPKEALLDTGRRKIVWVEKAHGEYEGQLVKLGPEANAMVDNISKQFYPVLSGLEKGDKVVTKANFLIDSQSQLTGSASGAYGGALEHQH